MSLNTMTLSKRKTPPKPSLFGRGPRQSLLRPGPRHRFDHPLLDPDFLADTLDLQAEQEDQHRADRVNETLRKIFQ